MTFSKCVRYFRLVFREQLRSESACREEKTDAAVTDSSTACPPSVHCSSYYTLYDFYFKITDPVDRDAVRRLRQPTGLQSTRLRSHLRLVRPYRPLHDGQCEPREDEHFAAACAERSTLHWRLHHQLSALSPYCSAANCILRQFRFILYCIDGIRIYSLRL